MLILTLLISTLCFIFAPMQEARAGAATPWSSGHKSKARLIAGAVIAQDNSSELYAAVEIALAPEWKTYWRHPGEAGGVPPYMDWSKSTNLATTETLFPAPKRFKDSVGDTIGYKEHIVLPTRIKPANSDKPINLVLDFHYGVCREICIPARAKFTLQVTPAQLHTTPPQLVKALQSIPVAMDKTTRDRPFVTRVELRAMQEKPDLVIDARFPLGLDGADLFVEALDRIYLPMAKRQAQTMPDIVRYRVDLSEGVDLKALTGSRLRFTVVSAAGSAEIEHTLR